MAIINRIRNFFGLSFELARTGFILRNEGTYLGLFWYLLSPILLFLLLFWVFKDRLGGDIAYYALYLLLGIIMFNFFQGVTLDSTRIMRDYSGIIKSINFSRWTLVGGIVLRNLFSHFFEFLLFAIIFIYLKGSVFILVYYIPVFFMFVLFTFGVSLILSSLSVFFVDLDNIWNFFIRLLWLATPIFYEIGGQDRLFFFNLFNPLYYFLSLARDSIIYARLSETYILAGVLVFTVLSSMLGFGIFYKYKNKIAERI